MCSIWAKLRTKNDIFADSIKPFYMKELKKILNYTLLEIGNWDLKVKALLIIIGIIIATKLFTWIVYSLLQHANRRKKGFDTRYFSLYQLGKYFLWFIATYFSLNIMGVHLGVLLASSTAIFVGIGLGFQQVFKDFMSGIVILVEGTIQVGHVIEINNMVVRVTDIHLRTTKVINRDDIFMIVPNHKIIEQSVINWTHNTESTRFLIQVNTGFDEDVNLVRRLLIESVMEEEAVLKDENHIPNVRLGSFGEYALEFELLFWSHRMFRIENIKSNIRYRIMEKFRSHNIKIPYPYREIQILGKDKIFNDR